MFGAFTFGELYFADIPQYEEVPPAPPAPEVEEVTGGGGAWVSDYRYKEKKPLRQIRVVQAHVWDRSKSHSKVWVEVEHRTAPKKTAITEAGARENSALLVSAQGSVERFAVGRAISISRASSRGLILNLGKAQSNGALKTYSQASLTRFALANIRLNSREQAAGVAEVAGYTKLSLSSAQSAVGAEHITEFTPEQMEMLITIAAKTFYND